MAQRRTPNQPSRPQRPSNPPSRPQRDSPQRNIPAQSPNPNRRKNGEGSDGGPRR